MSSDPSSRQFQLNNRSGTLAAFSASGFRYQTGRLKLAKWVVSLWCPSGLHFTLAEPRFDPFSLELKMRKPLSGEGGCANQNHRSANAPTMWPRSGGEEQRGRGWRGLGGFASGGGRVASLSPAAGGFFWQDLLISAEPMAAPRPGKGASLEPHSLFGPAAWSS